MSNYCVACGAEIPEGRQVCPSCESGRDLISRAAAIAAVSAVPMWNPEDRYRAVRALEGLK